MAFSPDFIDQVRQANDIVQVIQTWVPLKKAGASWKGLCPFHQERTPSFNVVPSKQIFHCFGCGEGGDVFAFVQKREKIDFVEALKLLAERAGIEVPELARDESGRRESEQRREAEEAQRRLLDLAAAWFRRNLEEGSEGAQALAYARKRGLDDAARERFGLGYAPADGAALLGAALKKGFSEAELAAAGLVVVNERGAYARFRARLMFPIHDPKGRLAGFGGRVLGAGEPKYLNSPEGPLFSKGKLLYPWDLAKPALGKRREALVCEGYMDAIACHQAGLDFAVATLGTALTADHARLLKRYVDRVVLLFDADAAGLRAARRAGEPLLEAGLEARVAHLEGVKDPDELLRRDGPAALEAVLESARPLLEFCVQAGLAAAGASPSPAQRAAVLADSFPLLARMASASEADAALAAAALAVGVSGEAARQDFAAFRKGEHRPVEAVAAPEAASPAPAQRASPELALVERELLALLVAHPELVESAKEELGPPSLCSPDLQAAADLLWRAPRGAVMLMEDDGSEAFKLGDALLSELIQRRLPQLAPPMDSLHDILRRRQKLQLERQAAARTLALRQAGGDEALKSSLLKEIQAFRQAIQELRNERR
ncbi:MAG TPA: DNA primase [bacterium]|nr:DNA primase [bacterium]